MLCSISPYPGADLQDGVKVSSEAAAVSIGDAVVVSPNATLTACTLRGRNLIGAAAKVHAGAVIELDAIIAPGAVVAADTHVGAAQLWAGSPARYVRDLTAAEIASVHESVAQAALLATQHGVEAKKSPQQCIDDVDQHFYRMVMHPDDIKKL